MSISNLLRRPPELGALEYLARLALGPLTLAVVAVGFTQGWERVWTPSVLLGTDALLALHWRDFGPVERLGRDPGGGLAPLTKLVGVAAIPLVPLSIADGEWLLAGAIALLAVAGAGLWLGWKWAAWAWGGYAVLAMAAWLKDLLSLAYRSALADTRLPMAQWRPLLTRLPSALFAAAVLTWVLEWRRRRSVESDPERP